MMKMHHLYVHDMKYMSCMKYMHFIFHVFLPTRNTCLYVYHEIHVYMYTTSICRVHIDMYFMMSWTHLHDMYFINTFLFIEGQHIRV